MAKTGRPFDGRLFDQSIFDCNEADIRPTLGGWSKRTARQTNWAPYVSKTS